MRFFQLVKMNMILLIKLPSSSTKATSNKFKMKHNPTIARKSFQVT
jgi:hypothetical protein